MAKTLIVGSRVLTVQRRPPFPQRRTHVGDWWDPFTWFNYVGPAAQSQSYPVMGTSTDSPLSPSYGYDLSSQDSSTLNPIGSDLSNYQAPPDANLGLTSEGSTYPTGTALGQDPAYAQSAPSPVVWWDPLTWF